MTAKPTRVLCCGDVQGKFTSLIKRVNAVNSKNGPFDMMLCVGEFFGPNEEDNLKIVDGQIEFPIPTYILGPCCPSTSGFYPEDSSEFSSNITYLGKKGVLNTATGLQIAYISGIEGASSNPCQFNADDINELIVPVKTQSGFLGVDILLTSMWPADVWTHAHNQPSTEIEGSPFISRLAAALKPRYHFSGMGIHYERQPYRNHRVLLEPAQHPTRFIGLSAVDNPAKEKWLYAFNLVPMKKLSREELTAQPPNASEFPYMTLLTEMLAKDAEEAKKDVSNNSNAHFRFDVSATEEESSQYGRKRRRNDDGGGEKRPAAPCWFCLSNVDAEKHLVVSVGDSCYAAMPKGPLVEDHVMILTIVAAENKVLDEVQKFKEAYTLMANKAGKTIVCFERNFKSQHMQIQVIPVPNNCVKSLRGAFFNAASLAGVELTLLQEEDQLTDVVNEGCPYFLAELPDGSRLFTRQMKNFPLQFGREVLASKPILDCEDKIDWRAAALSKNEEIRLVKQFQARFKPFDFTADDDSD